MIGKLLSIVLAIALTGCYKPLPKETRESEITTGIARKSAFIECMKLAAKIPRQSDDDVSDIVAECGSQSYYITNYMREFK